MAAQALKIDEADAMRQIMVSLFVMIDSLLKLVSYVYIADPIQVVGDIVSISPLLYLNSYVVTF
jgi:hypothetical protein